MEKIKGIIWIFIGIGIWLGVGLLLQSTFGSWPWWGWLVHLGALIVIAIIVFFICLGILLKDQSTSESSCSFPEHMYS